MTGFVLHLQSATRYQQVADVVSFVAQDASGSFGIQAHHARALTCLVFGLARYRTNESDWHYVALPGGVLYFRDNELFVNCRQFALGENFDAVSTALRDEIAAEERQLDALRRSLQQLEEQMFKRLWDMQRGSEGLR